MRRRAMLGALALAAGAPVVGARRASAREAVVVAVALRPVFRICAALVEGTSLRIEPVPAKLVGMAQLARTLARSNAALDRQLTAASAVVTAAGVWPEDPLFREARARNIWVVEIDATRSLGREKSSVAVIAQPTTDLPWRAQTPSARGLPYVWLGPSNGIRMAEIVAADLKRLSPEDAPRIEANLARFAAAVQALKAEYETRFLALADPRLLALTDRFGYLVNEFGLYVEAHMLEEDVRWTPDDFARLPAFIAERGITHALHHWQPSEQIAATLSRAGVRLVVLDDGEGETAAPLTSAADGYQADLRAALDRLLGALSP